MNKKFTLALFALITLLGNPATAANLFWTGGGSDNLWSNPDNWGGFTPVANDRLFFGGSTNLNTFNDYAAGTSFQQINFSSGAGPFVLDGNDVQLTISISSNGVIQPQLIKLNYEVTSVTNYAYGVLLQVDGAISGVGGTSVVNGGIVRLTGSNTYTGISKVDNGTLIVDSIGNVGGGSSNLGAPTNAADGTITLAAATGNGVLSYMGVGESTDRVVNLGGTSGGARLNQAGTGLLKFTSDLTATGLGNKALTLQGNTAGEGEIAGTIVDSTGNTTGLVKNGSGSWTLSGNNTFTGSTSISSGTLKLDYSINAGSKLSDTGVLALNGGTLELIGGSHSEAVASTTLNTGGTFIKQTGGTSTIALGAITFTGGAIDFDAANIATTTTGNTNGILSQRATVAGSDFAANDGSDNIVAYTGYTGFAGSMVANTNYSLAGNGSLGGNTGAASNTLKISTTGGGQSLALGASTLTLGALLFTGSNDYTISTSALNKISVALLHNYGSGNLYLGSHNGITQYGTGTTILTEVTTTNFNNTINGGTIQFSDNAQIGNISANRSITLNSGKLVADTTAGDIALNNAGNFSRTFTINEGGGTIDVIGGNSLTISGGIQSGALTGPLTFGSASSDGTIFLTGANNYQGTTVLRGGTVNLGVAENAGVTGPLGMSRAASPGSILLNGGILQYSAVNQFDYSGRFGTIAGQQYNVDTNGQNVTWSTALVSANGSLAKSGSGNLTLTAANTYTGTTSISAGTLILSGQGSIANSAAIDLENGGALDVSGVTGGFSVADGQTLRGAGSVIGEVTLSSGSTLSIGNSPGTMTFSDDLTLSSGSISDFEIDGLTAGFYDLAQGDVGSQTVTFGGTLNLIFQAGFNTAGSVQIFDFETYAGSFAVTNISGLAGGYSAIFDELTGTVTVSVIPEPSAWLLVMGGLTMVTILRRRR